MARKRLLGIRLGLLAAGLGFGLLLAECCLRLAGVSYPLWYYPDEFAGTRLRPNLRGWYIVEGRSYVRVNSFGFRDREHSLTKPAQRLRVAVLGDSFAEALQVSSEETFWHTLQRQLPQSIRGVMPVEVLNFGVSGYGTAQQLQVLRHHVWQFDPDIVLLAFFAGNDLRNNSPQLEPDRVRPFFYSDSRGGLRLDQTFLRHPDFLKARSLEIQLKVALINSSRLLQLANFWKTQPTAQVPVSAAIEGGLDDACFCPPTSVEWIEAWEITQRTIGQMHREVRRHNAQFFVATVTSASQVDPDPSRRRARAAQLGVADLEYAERRIADLGREHGFSVIRLADAMRRYAESQQEYLHGFPNTRLGTGHWNVAGHRLAGRLMAQAIAKSEEWASLFEQ